MPSPGGGKKNKVYIPFHEHQHAFVAAIHYTMLIAADSNSCLPSQCDLSQKYNDCIYLQAILLPYALDLTIQDVLPEFL
jgi:hypothetical protein